MATIYKLAVRLPDERSFQEPIFSPAFFEVICPIIAFPCYFGVLWVSLYVYEFFRRIFSTNFFDKFFGRIFWTNFLDEFFRQFFFWTNFEEYLNIAGFRIGVPLILLFKDFCPGLIAFPCYFGVLWVSLYVYEFFRRIFSTNFFDKFFGRIFWTNLFDNYFFRRILKNI
jgi:hypothetical protein